MIILHYHSGVPFWLDENKIECLDVHDVGTAIYTVSNKQYTCREKPDKVVELMHERQAPPVPLMAEIEEAVG